MKKLILLISILVLLPINNVFANETNTNINENNAISNENQPLYIFSEDFPNDYTKWTELEYINKMIYSIENYFGFDIKEEEIEIIGDGESIRIYPSELYYDGRGNTFTIINTDSQFNVYLQRKWKNNDEKKNYAIALIQMISNEKSKEELTEDFDIFQNQLENFLNNGFPQEVNYAINNSLTFAYNVLEPNRIFESIRLAYNLFDTVNNDNIIAIIGYLDEPITQFEEDGSYKFPINFKVDSVADKKIINAMVENPTFIEETTEEKAVTSDNTQNQKPSSTAFNPEDYDIYTYEEVMRDREGMAGKSWTFYAEVLQYFEHVNGTATALVYKNGNYDEIIMLQFLTLPDQRIVEDDILDVYGYSFGLTNYTTAIGSSITVPEVLVTKVLIQGIDY